MALRRSSLARALTLGVTIFAIVGLPALHAVVHELEEAAEDHDDDHDHHHDGDGPHEHHQHPDADTPEHLGMALVAAPPRPVAPPPAEGPKLLAPRARDGIVARAERRPGRTRGPPSIG